MSLMVVNILNSFLGEPYSHNEDSGQLKYDCPACAEDKELMGTDGKHNLEINYFKNRFNCWACGKTNHMHGPIEKLVKRYGTKHNLADYMLIKPEEEDVEEYLDNIKRDRVIALPEGFRLLKDSNDTHPRYKWAMHYLKQRGITDEIIDRYDIGFVSEGLYRDRIIIPSYDSNSILNFFIARSFNDKVKPKYLNPSIEKQELIFNEKLLNYDATIFLVEGAFDHIVIPNSVPLLGKVLHPKLKLELLEKANADIVIVLDDDAYLDAKAIKRELNIDRLEGRIKLCVLPEGYDPSKINEEYGKKGIIDLLRTSN